MGLSLAYMSKPITKKYSTNESNDKLNCGTSCMQGWRDSQEDAHNCILDYDTNTSYFAVYDGHGGDDVSLYTSRNLPDFIKTLDEYAKGNIEKALEEAFLKFDATLMTRDVIIELQRLRRIAQKRERKRSERRRRRRQKSMAKRLRNLDRDDEHRLTDEENVNNLYEDAAMPLEEILGKYIAGQLEHLSKEQNEKDKHDVASSSTSVANIPESSGEAVSTSSFNGNHKTNLKNEDPDDQKSTCSGTQSNDIESSTTKPDVKVDSPDSSGNTQGVCAPSDAGNDEITSANAKDESTETCESSKLEISSSSTVPLENGEVKKGKGKALKKTKGVVPDSPAATQKPKKSAKELYKSILDEEWSDDESEDENFVVPNDGDSDSDGQGSDKDNDENGSDVEEEEDGDSASTSHDEDDNSAEIEEEEEGVVEGEGENDDDDDDDDDEGVNVEDDNVAEAAAVDDDDNDVEDMIIRRGPGLDSGCTAVVALLRGNTLYVANAGDSRCVICRNGEAIDMSIDHNPEDIRERNRIKKAGGFISDGRVNGGLNLSRAIGDHGYKQNKSLSEREQMITALPDVKKLEITPEDEFMILACDGIWNSMSSQEGVDFVRKRIREGKEELSRICEELFDQLLAPDAVFNTFGCDNMTAIIVQFKPKESLKRATSEEPEQATKVMKTEEKSST